MIPKVIHYCWFGGNPLDDLSLKCIASWKKYFPDYEIIQWNENNFDVSQLEFMEKAYMDKKWAFVSDVARLLILYKYGGLYFDTDVEVISDYEDILCKDVEGFLGFEKTNAVSTGLGFGAMPNHPLIKELINVYKNLNYDQYADCLSQIACPILTTQLMEKYGYIAEDKMQECCGFVVYPSDYFSPIDYMNGKLLRTDRTHSIHWYNASWNEEETKEELVVARKFRRLFGIKMGDTVCGIISCIKKEGIINYISTRIKKLSKLIKS